MALQRGKYIVIEGTDGSGTTSQKDKLKQSLLDAGQEVIDVAEPGGTPIGDALRLIIKDGSLMRSPETDLDLFTACRRELAQQVIKPALAKGISVLSDRNWFSTIAYQGYGEGMDVSAIVERTRIALGQCFIPDITFIIDVPVEVSEERMKLRNSGANDYFEQKGREFFEKVRQGYLWVSDEYQLPVIDGTKSIEEVHSDIRLYLEDMVPLLKTAL